LKRFYWQLYVIYLMNRLLSSKLEFCLAKNILKLLRTTASTKAGSLISSMEGFDLK